MVKYLSCVLLFLLVGCDVFKARTPEPPEGTGGTWLQPDTPERVVENIKNAIANLSTQNYIRSLATTFQFQPTLEAQTRDALLWNNWSLTEEESYFNRLKTAGEILEGHLLQLVDVNQIVLDNTHYLYDANYLLTVPHSRTDEGISTQFQGKFVWTLVQGSDGLWRLENWIDQSNGIAPSWSDLKASFGK